MSTEVLRQLESIWPVGLGRPDVRIAVLDGPVDLSHPCFVGSNLQELDVLGRAKSSSEAARRHGTQVASIIFSQHREGELRGVAPGCSGLLIPLYEQQGDELRCTHDDLARAITAAVDAGAAVINISGGELWDRGPLSAELVQAVVNAAQRGSLIVAAAGNDGCQDCLHVPAMLPGVIAVGSATQAGDLDARSNRGSVYERNGVTAPGVAIVTAAPGGTFARATGTSFATPFVSGIAALLASATGTPTERINLQVVREIILSSSDPADPTSTSANGFAGQINPSRAFEFIHHRFQQPPEESSMSLAAEVTLSPLENLPATTAISTAGLIPASSEGLEPSGCGCGGGQEKGPQYIYAIGQLSVDFLHETRKLSLEEHDEVNRVLGGRFGRVTESIGGLLRYLLGVDIDRMVAALGCDKLSDDECPPPTGCDHDCASLSCLGPDDLLRLCALLKKKAFNGHFYDAESVQWVLRQDECPLYVIRPTGAFAREAYQQILIFFIEQIFTSLPQFRCEFIKSRCLTSFYPCNGGTQGGFLDCLESPYCDGDGTAAKRAPKGKKDGDDCGCDGDEGDDYGSNPITMSGIELLGEKLSCASHVAIAGEIIGKTRLYSGEVVPVIAPALRGCANWNSRALLNSIDCNRDKLLASILRTLAALYEHTRNPGVTECERAKNYWATQIFDSLGALLSSDYLLALFGIARSQPDWETEALKIVPGELTCEPATCNPLGSKTMDVALSFYKFDNAFGGDAVISQPIDVADVVPTLRGKYRIFQRRNR